MYNFTSFAMVLNEVDKEMESVIPKTDCKLRPDIRAMENGEIDQASEEKKPLEEKQRAARKNRSKSEEDWKTRCAEGLGCVDGGGVLADVWTTERGSPHPASCPQA